MCVTPYDGVMMSHSSQSEVYAARNICHVKRNYKVAQAAALNHNLLPSNRKSDTQKQKKHVLYQGSGR